MPQKTPALADLGRKPIESQDSGISNFRNWIWAGLGKTPRERGDRVLNQVLEH